MDYIEYVLVGLAVAAALGYAVWRLRRAFQGKDGCGCAFSGSDAPPCQDCAESCEEKADEERESA